MSRREHYRLRPVHKSDLEKLLRWRNSEHVRVHMFSDHIITIEEHKAWLANLLNAQFPTFMIFELKERPVGVVNAGYLDRQNRRCSWGFYIGETDVPRGTGLIMGYLGLEYFFEQLNVHKVCGEVLAFNRASIACHKKLGCKQEGHFSKHVLKNGRYNDVISFALFKEDWRKLKKRLEELCFYSKRS